MSLLVVGLVLGTLVWLAPNAAHAWESALFPADWEPGFSDSSGRFLHDFSYAGYHAGAEPIPETPPGDVVDVTQAPYNADPSGRDDVTAILQQAIDDVGAQGGGVVFLPAGTYRVSVPETRNHALLIKHDGVVLRGEGPDRTEIYNETTRMHQKRVILIAPREEYFAWIWLNDDARTITQDLGGPTTQIPVGDASGYAPGDWIIVRSDATPEMLAELGMQGTWTLQDFQGPAFYRRIESVDGNTITIDAPTRWPLLTRDNARIHRVLDHVEEVGIESLAIGNRQNDTPGTDTRDYQTEGTGAWEMHASFGIYFNHVVNGWVRDVKSYRPSQNSRNIHLLSNGIRMDFSRWITLDDVHIANPQYKGAGGNGYNFVLTGNDCLITDALAENGRHNFSFAFIWSSGNVIHRSTARNGELPADFHQRLSIANLIDNLTLDGDYYEAVWRDCCNHGHSSSQNVFWNTNGLAYPSDQWPWENFIIETQQYGHGYVIGTRGPADQVDAQSGDGAGPTDFVEGVGQGDTLEPASLYEVQVERRLGIQIGPDPDPEPDPDPDPEVDDPPVVDAGPDQTVTWSGEPVTVQLDGTVTDDGDSTLTTEWTLVLGAGGVTIAEAESLQTAVTLDAPGFYTFRLSATDATGTVIDDVKVAVDDGMLPDDPDTADTANPGSDTSLGSDTRVGSDTQLGSDFSDAPGANQGGDSGGDCACNSVTGSLADVRDRGHAAWAVLLVVLGLLLFGRRGRRRSR